MTRGTQVRKKGGKVAARGAWAIWSSWDPPDRRGVPQQDPDGWPERRRHPAPGRPGRGPDRRGTGGGGGGRVAALTREWGGGRQARNPAGRRRHPEGTQCRARTEARAWSIRKDYLRAPRYSPLGSLPWERVGRMENSPLSRCQISPLRSLLQKRYKNVSLRFGQEESGSPHL